jgi:hypothetical protein
MFTPDHGVVTRCDTTPRGGRVEIMGSPTCRIVGKSQAVLIVIDPMISTRTRNVKTRGFEPGSGFVAAEGVVVARPDPALLAPPHTTRYGTAQHSTAQHSGGRL